MDRELSEKDSEIERLRQQLAELEAARPSEPATQADCDIDMSGAVEQLATKDAIIESLKREIERMAASEDHLIEITGRNEYELQRLAEDLFRQKEFLNSVILADKISRSIIDIERNSRDEARLDLLHHESALDVALDMCEELEHDCVRMSRVVETETMTVGALRQEISSLTETLRLARLQTKNQMDMRDHYRKRVERLEAALNRPIHAIARERATAWFANLKQKLFRSE
jgi:hypothetical protein